MTGYLRGEYAQSQNIKDRTTRKNVCWAIEALINRLKCFKTTPANGLVLFVGTRALPGNKSETVSEVLEPPEPVAAFVYRCDSHFFLEPLQEMVADKEVYGLLVLDRHEMTIGLLKGKRIITLLNKESLVPSKHDAGGQSQRRFERGIEGLALLWLKKVGNLASEAFLAEKNLKGIIIGGPGYTKRDFVRDEHLHHELRKLVLPTVYDQEYTDEYGLKQLVNYAQDALAGLGLIKEQKLMQRLLEQIRKPNGGLSLYGEAQVRAALERGAVDTLLVSEKMPLGRVRELTGAAERAGTDNEMISVESDDGQALYATFGGIAGLLRYRP